MDDLSYFESRSGMLTCNAEELFAFVTDIRNFGQFIPDGTITSWHAERELCSFSVSMVGTVTVRLAEKEKLNPVSVYTSLLRYEQKNQKPHNPPNGKAPKAYLGWLKEHGYNPFNL